MKTLNLKNRKFTWAPKLMLILMITSSFALSSCLKKDKNDDPQPGFQSQAPEFDMALFEDNLKSSIMWNNDQPIGWAYAISKDGQLARSGALGDARTSVDGQEDFTLLKEINVASVSKFYTAIAAMQLLEANGLTIDSKIISYLPPSWNKGPGVNNLTFGDLLTHSSGLQSQNSNFSATLGYEGLKTCISTGVVQAKARNYLNVNFALFRVLIPSLWSQLQNAPTINIESDLNTQTRYIEYMSQYVFNPIGLSKITCEPEDRTKCTLYYNINDEQNNQNGAYYGSWTAMSGGGGYFMSCLEMSRVLAYFEHTEDIISDESRDIMKENRIGMDLEDAADEVHGAYYGKGGSISNGNNQGVLTQMVMFPNIGVDCVVVMNTRGVTLKGNNSLRQIIYDAFNDAWVSPN